MKETKAGLTVPDDAPDVVNPKAIVRACHDDLTLALVVLRSRRGYGNEKAARFVDTAIRRLKDAHKWIQA